VGKLFLTETKRPAISADALAKQVRLRMMEAVAKEGDDPGDESQLGMSA
jgi:hypothetical protein